MRMPGATYHRRDFAEQHTPAKREVRAALGTELQGGAEWDGGGLVRPGQKLNVAFQGTEQNSI